MNRLYRLYFYLRFWAAQASKKFIEFISGTYSRVETDLTTLPSKDVSNTLDINVEFEVSGEASGTEDIHFNIGDLSGGEVSLYVTPIQDISWINDIVLESEVEFVSATGQELDFILNSVSSFDEITLYASSDASLSWTVDIEPEFEVDFTAGVENYLSPKIGSVSAFEVEGQAAYTTELEVGRLNIQPLYEMSMIPASYVNTFRYNLSDLGTFYFESDFISANLLNIQAGGYIANHFETDDLISSSPVSTGASNGLVLGFSTTMTISSAKLND